MKAKDETAHCGDTARRTPGQKNREHSQYGKRKPRTVVSYDDAEWIVIVQAAAVDGLRRGSFVSRAGLDAARAKLAGVKSDRRVLIELNEAITDHRNQLAKIGGNLNDVARHANSTHEVETVREQALAILSVVRQQIATAHALQAALRENLG